MNIPEDKGKRPPVQEYKTANFGEIEDLAKSAEIADTSFDLDLKNDNKLQQSMPARKMKQLQEPKRNKHALTKGKKKTKTDPI